MKSWNYYSCESFLLVKSMQSFVFKKVFPNLNLLIWTHQGKHQKNLFKNKDKDTTLMVLLWCLVVNFEPISHIVLVFPLLALKKIIADYSKYPRIIYLCC